MFLLGSDNMVELVSAEATLEELVKEKVVPKKPAKPATPPSAAANATNDTDATASATDATTTASSSDAAPATDAAAAEDKEKAAPLSTDPPATEAPTEAPAAPVEEFKMVKKVRTFPLKITSEVPDLKPVTAAHLAAARTM